MAMFRMLGGRDCPCRGTKPQWRPLPRGLKCIPIIAKKLGVFGQRLPGKEEGIANSMGIFAASRALRHSDIRVTSQYYSDKSESQQGWIICMVSLTLLLTICKIGQLVTRALSAGFLLYMHAAVQQAIDAFRWRSLTLLKSRSGWAVNPGTFDQVAHW